MFLLFTGVRVVLLWPWCGVCQGPVVLAWASLIVLDAARADSVRGVVKGNEHFVRALSDLSWCVPSR